ncbi:TKL family protein kinase [Trichomonas vaginalis G3]|uniref:TKL family protein kinase n=1 Tax=Trichomonas vaginalis (strain ATCC PRA-98 / G3) TaxID=412133 RepID=A2E0X6_TRIV3|nr:protein kinase protein [Trichomonas vaginalis G3]EAY13731.1 TKL family protein kinase [Trichomonas vaginalis G3]KAI5529664.1 protein kinase protein [Trichomonas vaginalis G3]|eukprot:XP_001325954.1 TKL family protein kinase [Trichomonas vaginalis G3]
MNEVSKTVAQHASALKQTLFAVGKSFKNVVVHKSKLGTFNSELSAFYKSILKTSFSNSLADQTTADFFTALINEINLVKILFESLTEKTFVSTTTNNKLDYVKAFLQETSKNINQYAMQLQLVPNPPLSDNIPNYVENEKEDCKALISALNSYATSNTVQQTMANLRLFMSNLDEDQNESTKGDPNAVTNQQIEEGFKEFSQYFCKESDFELSKKIGQGAFSTVYHGFQKSTGHPVAMKKLNSGILTKEQFETYLREIRILTSLNHFAITPFVGVTPKEPYYIITQLMRGDCLFYRLHAQRNPLSPTKLTIIALGIAYGLAYLHSEKIMHRDIKSLNILLDNDDYPHICDFGCARFMDGRRYSIKVGTTQWMAPEMYEIDCYSFKVDIYSYGILLWEMLTGQIPFANLKDVDILPMVINGERPPIPSSCPSGLAKLIKSCWDVDPNKRPSSAQIVQVFERGEVFFQDADMDKVEIYRKSFAMSAETQINNFDVNNVNSMHLADIIEMIIKGDMQSKNKAIGYLAQLVQDMKWFDIIGQYKIINKLPDILKSCNSARLASEIIVIIDNILQIPQIRSELYNSGITNQLVKYFDKYGDETMVSFVSAFSSSIFGEQVKPNLTKTFCEKYAQFLSIMHQDDIQQRAFETFELIITKQFTTDNDAIASMLSPFIVSYIPMMPSMNAERVVDILLYLVSLGKTVIHKICALDGPTIIFPLLSIDYLASNVMTVLLKICSEKQPSAKFANMVVSELPRLCDQFPNEQTVRPLLLLSTVVLIQTTYNCIAQMPSSVSALATCIRSGYAQVSVVALKLAFIFLENETSAPSMLFIVPDVKSRLNTLFVADEISTLAANCLILLISLKPQSFISDAAIINYINAALSCDDNQVIIVALRIIGVLAQSKEGSIDLKNGQIISKIVEIALKKNREVRFYAVAALTVISKAISYTPEFEPIIETLFNLSADDMSSTTVPSFLYNIVNESSEGSLACAGYVKRIAEKCSSDSFAASAYPAMTAIALIVSDDKAKQKVLQTVDINEVVKIIVPLIEKGYGRAVFYTLAEIIDVDGVIGAAKEAGIADIIASSLAVVQKETKLHESMMKVHSAIANDE